MRDYTYIVPPIVFTALTSHFPFPNFPNIPVIPIVMAKFWTA